MISWNDIIGHDRIKTFFQRAVEKDRLFSTYLFSGPEGIGKRLTARTVGAMLNCELPNEGPCGQCRSCRNIETGNHVDVQEIRAEKDEIKSEQMETILERVPFPPYEGRTRVTIVDNAHQFNRTSGNMMLKTLEEPPDGNYFFLITSKPDLLLPTIRSRCQQVGFTTAGLEDRLQVDGIEPAVLKPWLRSGGGVVLEAGPVLEFAEQRKLALSFLEFLTTEEPGFRMEDRISEQLPDVRREQALQFLFQIQTLIRDLLVLKSKKTDQLVNLDLAPSLEKLEPSFGPDQLFQLNHLVNRGKNSVFYNISIQHLITVLVAEGRKLVS